MKHLFPPSSCKKQINKQNSYLLLAFLQSGSVPELDMYESKHFLPGQFVHSVLTQGAIRKHISKAKLAFCVIMALSHRRLHNIKFKFNSTSVHLHG